MRVEWQTEVFTPRADEADGAVPVFVEIGFRQRLGARDGEAHLARRGVGEETDGVEVLPRRTGCDDESHGEAQLPFLL